jgi:molecular chaperone GrpE
MTEMTSNIPDPADNDASTTASESALTGEVMAGSPDDMTALEAQKERYLRLAAEFDNYRKRTSKEAQQAAMRGQADLVRMLVTSLDDLDRIAQLDPAVTDAESVVKGVIMVEKNILKSLTDLGVEIIDPLEMPFDPNLHEAVTTVAASAPEEDHLVAQVYQRGYLLRGQLLRPARVVVKQY